MGRGPSYDWSGLPVGVATDAEVAALIGCSPSAVFQHRLAHGIAPAFGRGRPRLRGSVDLSLLGTASDLAVARACAVSEKTVERARRSRGIAGFRPRRKEPRPSTWVVDWSTQPLGMVPDSWIAKAIGVNTSTVSSARQRRGISKATVRGWSTCRCGAGFEWLHSGRGRIKAICDRCARSKTPVPRAMRRRVLDRDDHTCQYCGARDVNLHADHVAPKARGGATHPSNLVASCGPCNLRKGSRPLDNHRAALLLAGIEARTRVG